MTECLKTPNDVITQTSHIQVNGDTNDQKMRGKQVWSTDGLNRPCDEASSIKTREHQVILIELDPVVIKRTNRWTRV